MDSKSIPVLGVSRYALFRWVNSVRSYGEGGGPNVF